MLIGADTFLHSVHTFRNVWLTGRYGGGKTLLSVVVADYMNRLYKYQTFSNIPVFLPSVVDALRPCDCCTPSKFHSVIIYDEAWLSLGSGASPKQIKSYLAYLRKLDLIMLMPSVLPLARSAFLLWCERKYNFGSLGLPLWVYEWGLPGQTAKKSGGSFMLWKPQGYFGRYDTLAQPDELTSLFSQFAG